MADLPAVQPPTVTAYLFDTRYSQPEEIRGVWRPLVVDGEQRGLVFWHGNHTPEPAAWPTAHEALVAAANRAHARVRALRSATVMLDEKEKHAAWLVEQAKGASE